MIAFGEYTIDLSKRVLRRNGEKVHLAKKPFDVLVYLIEHHGDLVTREELLTEFWSGGQTYDEAVYSCVSSIRKALRDLGSEPRFIETRWREGYRFIGEIHREETGPEEPSSLAARKRSLSYGLAAMAAILLSAIGWFLLSETAPNAGPERRATQGASPPISSIAVLPIQGLDIDHWLRQGLTDELLHTISSIEGIRVVRVTGDGPLDDALLQHLDVDALLESTLLIADDSRDLHLRLLRVNDLSIAWSFHARYRTGQLAESRAKVVASLANHLSASLRGSPIASPADPRAWPPYLRARYQWSLRTPQSIRAAVDLYKEVIDLDPDYADAHAGLAEAYVVAPLWAGTNSKEAYGEALRSAQRALELDADNARAHAALAAYYAHHDFDWARAEHYFGRALQLDPNAVTAHQWKADAYCYRLLFDECTRHMAIAKSLDPLSPFIELLQGIPLRFTKQYAAAEAHFRDVLDRYPNLAPARFQLGIVLDAQGRFEDAIEQFERIYPVYGPALVGSSLAWGHAQLGNHDEAREMIAALHRLNEEGFVSPIMMAGAALTYGRDDDVLRWLTRARDDNDDFFSTIAVIHHFFPLHTNPEFQALAAELGIPRDRLLDYHASAPQIPDTSGVSTR